MTKEPAADPDPTPGRRVLLALVDEAQEYQRLQAAEAAVAAERAGISLETVFAENNAIAQIYQVFARVHAPRDSRPRVIVAHPVAGDGLERVARSAVRAGIGWIVLNMRVRYLEELIAEARELPLSSVSPDNLGIGRLHGQQVRALVPDGGVLLYIQGPPDTSAAQDRLRGMQEGLAGARFDWKVLQGDWTETGGEKAIAGFLRLKGHEGARPAIVVAQNDAMAIGARRIIRALCPDWSTVRFLGCDGLPTAGQRLVNEGELAATVIMPSTAGHAVDMVGAWLNRGIPPPPKVILQPSSFMPVGAGQARSAGKAKA